MSAIVASLKGKLSCLKGKSVWSNCITYKRHIEEEEEEEVDSIEGEEC